MSKAIKITCYVIGTIIILFGVVFITEYLAEISMQTKAPYLALYPVIGPVLIIIGVIIFYYGNRLSRKRKLQI